MYRPEPVRPLSVWLPPVPPVTVLMVAQVALSVEVWTWKSLPYAASQLIVTWQIDWTEPRSTRSHCGSLAALDQRVPPLPSTADEAGVPAFSVVDAAAVLPSATIAAAAA